MDEARQAVWNLRGGEAAASTLEASLQQMSERVSREYGVAVECAIQGTPFAIGQQATHELMMVAREAIYNAVLHGHPEKITALLRFSAKQLEMMLRDDGKGFDAAEAPAEGHYGLQGLRERVYRFDGEVEIESSIAGGATVHVRIPRAKLDI